MKYFIVSLGCATNKSDAERIAAVLDSIGYTPAESEQDADLLGLVACSIRQSAIDRVIGRAKHWNEWKQEKKLITFVSGCVLPDDKKRFTKSFDFVIELEKILELPQLLQQYGIGTPKEFWDIEPHRDSSFRAFVPIQNGCNNFCTYCAVPYTRGREVSRPSESIYKEIQTLLDKGYKQITILGQNVNSYGLDVPEKEPTFAELLRTIGQMADTSSQQVRVYYTSPHPKDMNKEVYEVQSEYESLAPYLNLPLQSGNTQVLKRMNRRYTVEEFMSKLSLAREIIPDITVSTDIIVGFCGETDEQFQDTVDVMEKAAFDMAYIAQYSPRPNAVANERFKDDVPKDEKKKRDQHATEVLKKTALASNDKLVKTTQQVLVESQSRKQGKLVGRTQGLKSVEFFGDPSLIGEYVNVKITGCDPWRLFAEQI